MTQTTGSNQIIDERLDNGLRVVIEPMPDVSSAAAGFLARAGSRDEPAEWAGISHFLEHMCFKGTRRRHWRQITIDFDNMGAHYNAFTAKERTFYFGWVRRADIARQIELIADMMRPSLPPDELEMERKVILEEIAMSADDLDHLATDLLHEKVFAGHPLSWPILGYRETIERLSREDMAEYLGRFYSPSNMALVVAGNVEPKEVFAAAESATQDWEDRSDRPPRRPPQTLYTGTTVQVIERFNQQCICIAPPAAPGGPDEERLGAITSILGGENSRFYWNIVRKGIAPRAGAWPCDYTDCGLLVLYGFCEPANAERLTEAMQSEAARLQSDGIRPDELQRVKNRRRTALALEGEAAYNRLIQMMFDIEYHDRPRTLDERLAGIEAVTVDSLHEYLQRWPLTKEGYFVSVGPRDWPAI